MISPQDAGLFPGSLTWSVVGAAWAWGLGLLQGAAVLPLDAREERGGAAAASRLLVWAVAGMAISSLAWLVLSWAGALRPPVVLAAALALTVAGMPLGGRRVLRTTDELVRSLRVASFEQPLVAMASLIGLSLLVILALRFAVVPSVHYDDLVYHLGLPRQALLTGTWPALPHFHHSLMPAAWEVTYVLSLALGGGSGPQLMNVVALALLGGAVALACRRLAGPCAALAATALLLCCPMFLGSAALAGNDLAMSLALVVALERLLHPEPRAAVVGILVGVALSIKLAAVPAGVAIIVGAALLPAPWRARNLGRALALGATALAVASPWLVRSWADTRNPVYPALYSTLGGEGWSEEAARLLTNDSSQGAFPTRGGSAFVLALRDMVLRSGRLGAPAGLDPLAPLLGIAGFLALSWRNRTLRCIAAMALVAYLGWAATALMLRFAIPLLAMLLVAAACLLDEGLRRGAKLSSPRLVDACAAALILLAVSGPLLRAIKVHLSLYGGSVTVAGGVAREEVLASLLDLADAEKAMATTMPAAARVLVIGEARIALVPRPVLASTALDEPEVGRFLEGATTAADVTERVAREATHVLVNGRELARWNEKYGLEARLPAGSAPLFREWLAHGLTPVGRWGSVFLFEARPTAMASATPPVSGEELR